VEAIRVSGASPGDRDGSSLGGGEGQQAVADYQRMVAQLQRQSHPAGNLWMKLTPGAGHNEGAWRAEFAAAVAWMFAAGK
jgi:hypothetical protein